MTSAKNINIKPTGNNIITVGNTDNTVNISGQDVNINPSGQLLVTPANVDINTTASTTIDAAAASNFTTSSGELTLQGAGGLNLVGRWRKSNRYNNIWNG